MRQTRAAAPLTAAERHLVDRCASGSGRGTLTGLERLSVGDSGALVLRARWGSRRVVLKITTESDRLVRARTERQLLAERPAGVADAMPVYVGGHESPDLVCVITEECLPMSSPGRLGIETWVEIAAFLGRLHTATIPDLALRASGSAPTPDEVAHARDFWRGRGLLEPADRAAALLGHDQRDAEGFAWPPTVLTHGDCHLDNLVRDRHGRLRLVDWQEVVLADGLGDLGFLCQRAEFDGASPPRELMVQAYAAARGLTCDAGLRRALARVELPSLFVGWPPFLHHGTPARQRLLQDRIATLVALLDPGGTAGP